VTRTESITRSRSLPGAAVLALVVAMLGAALGPWADAAPNSVYLVQSSEARPWSTTTDLEVRPASDTSGVDVEADEARIVSQLPSAAASLREERGGDVPKSGLSRGAELRAKYGAMSIEDIHARINARGLMPETWNQFRTANRGLFSSQAQAGRAWAAYKGAHGIERVARSQAAKRQFLLQLAASGKAPAWMNQWLRQGKVPLGFEVDHIKALSVGGLDDPSNMRLLDKAFHDLHHSPGFYRPWE